MLHHYIIGVGAFVLLSAAWVGVQRAWRKSFPDAGDDPDALAGRPGCGDCGRSQRCHEGTDSGTCEAEEEMR
ncbi:MAG: hypothetical protein AMJ62_03915 [Myxococcales bacterium SG8_38]|nr:MAG: hypothetical protein AMJ62_03915 [Myxococcales bacterium SG8_38]